MMENKTVILIDGNVSLIDDIQKYFLLEPNFEIVSTATTANDGWNIIQQKKVDYIVISSELPDADLLQVLSAIKQQLNLQSKIIATINADNAMLQNQAQGAGADLVLKQPYGAEELIEAMKQLLAGPLSQSPFGGPGNSFSPNSQGMSNTGGSSVQPFNNSNNNGNNHQQSNPFAQGGNLNNQQSNPQAASNQFGNNQHSGQSPFSGGGFQGGGGSPFQRQQSNNMMQQQPNNNLNSGSVRTLKQSIIAINCPKGGVGKTTLSKELAAAFAAVKVNGVPLQVCIVDCDLDFGDVASMLKTNAYPNITQWSADIKQRLKKESKQDIRYSQAEAMKYLLQPDPDRFPNFRLLAAPTNHIDALDITSDEMEIIINALRNCNFDVIVLDTGNNSKDNTLIAMEKAQQVLMVVTLDITSINDAKQLLDTLRQIQFPVHKMKLVVNREPKHATDIDISEIPQVLNMEVLQNIPKFDDMRQINNSGIPAVWGKDNEFTTAVRKLGHKLVPVFNKKLRKKRGKKLGFLSKLFKRK